MRIDQEGSHHLIQEESLYQKLALLGLELGLTASRMERNVGLPAVYDILLQQPKRLIQT